MSKRPALKLWQVYGIVVGLLAASGLFGAYKEHSWSAFEGPLATIALGSGPATCLAWGLRVVRDVNHGRRKRTSGVLVVLALPVPCALLTAFALLTAGGVLPWFLRGEQGTWALMLLPLWSLIGSAVIAAVLALCVARWRIRPPPSEQDRSARPDDK